MTTSAKLLLGIAVLALLAVTVALVHDAGAAPPRPAVSSPLVGIVEGQRAHLTLVNAGGKRGTTGTCEAALSFVDDQGRLLKQQAVTLAPGQGTFLALDFNEAPPTNDRVRLHYRAVVTPTNDACDGAITGHEMINNLDSKTSVFIGVYQD
jgi:hypothetical protein